MKVYLNKEYKCVKVEDNTFVANDSSNYIRYYFVTNANGDVIDKMDDTSVIYRNTEPSYVTVAFRRADGDVIQHLMASPKTDATGKSFFEYEITNTDGVLYKKGALEISAQFIEATLSETGGVKKVISQKVKAIAINTAHVLDNIGEEAEEYYSQYEQANNDAHAVLQAQITTNFNNIGTLQELTTDAKDDLVKAINEVDAHADANKSEIGDLSALTTDEKTTIVGAINEVDNHANTAQQTADNATVLANTGISKAEQAQATANNAVATANEAKTTAQTAENNANSAVDKADNAIDRANKAYEKAANNVYAVGFMTLQEAITAVNGYDNTVLKTNDNILVVAQGSPDLYVTSVEATSVPYNFTTVDDFNDDLVKNTVLQIGYYKVAFYETDGQPVTVAWQNVVVNNWVASTEFADFPYEAKIELTDFVDYKTVPQVVFDIADTMSGNYAPICKSGDKCVYIYGKVQNEITLKTVITFAPNVNGASVTGGGYANKGKWVASTTYAIDDLVYTDNGQYVCIEGITSTTSPEQDTTHWQATFVATGKTKNTLTISGQDNGTGVQKTFDGSQAVEIAFDETTMTAKEVNGVLKVGAKGTIPEALPQTVGALTSGDLPTSGWTMLNENWEGSTLPASRSWQSVTYGDGKYVAVASNSSAGAYSTDGISWTEFSLPAYRKWYSVAYGNGKFVAVAFDSDKGAYSTDGITWTEFSLPVNSSSWNIVVYGNGKYIAVASNSLVGAYSTDGITWTEMTLPASRYWQSITYGGGKYVMVAQNITYGSYSTDGINWSSLTLPASRSWKSVAYGGGKFVAVAMDIDKGAYSTDGINWTEMTLPRSDTWQSVTYGNGKFIAVARNNVAYSAYSTDGINWKLISMPERANWYSVTYGDRKYVTVAQSSTSGAYQKASKSTYTISDTSITANSDILMELTDDGGVKSYSMEAGKMTVIRDTVPTNPIPYTYKVKQTNASGQFTLVNHYVPTIPETPTALPQEASALKSGSLPTSGWTATSPLIGSYKAINAYHFNNFGFIEGNKYTITYKLKSSSTLKTETVTAVKRNYLSNPKVYTVGVAFENGDFYIEDGIFWYVQNNGFVIDRTITNQASLRCYKDIEITNITGDLSNTVYHYTISDTSITANSDILMELTDNGGVKSYSMEAGNITVIRDTVPTQPIPYTYKVKQTNTSGQFTLVNHFVPTKTSELTNDSGFITAADIPSAGEWVDVAGETATLTQAGTYQVIASVNDMQSIVYWDGSTAAYGTKSTAPSVSTSGGTAYLFINCAYPQIDASGTLTVHLLTAGNSSGAWTETDTVQSGFKYRKIN